MVVLGPNLLVHVRKRLWSQIIRLDSQNVRGTLRRNPLAGGHQREDTANSIADVGRLPAHHLGGVGTAIVPKAQDPVVVGGQYGPDKDVALQHEHGRHGVGTFPHLVEGDAGAGSKGLLVKEEVDGVTGITDGGGGAAAAAAVVDAKGQVAEPVQDTAAFVGVGGRLVHRAAGAEEESLPVRSEVLVVGEDGRAGGVGSYGRQRLAEMGEQVGKVGS